MTKQQFIDIVNLKSGYYYISEKDALIIVNGWGSVEFNDLTSLPQGVKFNNDGDVFLHNLISLPEGTRFYNKGSVFLDSLTYLPDEMEFNNKEDVFLDSLSSLPIGVKFYNGGNIVLNSLTFLPESTTFYNKGCVDLRSLTALPEGIQFNNEGPLFLDGVTSLSERVTFNHQGSVFLSSLCFLSEGFQKKYTVPVIKQIDRHIYQTLLAGGKLEMKIAHTNEMTHSREGWAIHLAGEKGYSLEKKFGSEGAGALIYAASRPGIPVPDYNADNETAMNDIKKWALEKS